MRVTVLDAMPADVPSLRELLADCSEHYCAEHLPALRWCPAGMTLPHSFDHDASRFIIAKVEGCIVACISVRADSNRRELRVSLPVPCNTPANEKSNILLDLFLYLIKQARAEGWEEVRAIYHDLPDVLASPFQLLEQLGWHGSHRFEMIGHSFLEPPATDLRIASASEVGEEAFFAAEVAVEKSASIDESRTDCLISQRMWHVEPATDWLIGYTGDQPAGIVRVAVARNGVGVVDNLVIAPIERNRGYGTVLLAHGMIALRPRTDTVWLDVDADNLPALRLYRKAGFGIHHLHGEWEYTLH